MISLKLKGLKPQVSFEYEGSGKKKRNGMDNLDSPEKTKIYISQKQKVSIIISKKTKDFIEVKKK